MKLDGRKAVVPAVETTGTVIQWGKTEDHTILVGLWNLKTGLTLLNCFV